MERTVVRAVILDRSGLSDCGEARSRGESRSRQPAGIRACRGAFVTVRGRDGARRIGARRIGARRIGARRIGVRRDIARAEHSAADQCKDEASQTQPQLAAQTRRGTQQTELWMHMVRLGHGRLLRASPVPSARCRGLNPRIAKPFRIERPESRCRALAVPDAARARRAKARSIRRVQETAMLGQRSCFIAAAIALACAPSGRGSMAEEASWSSEPRAPGNTLSLEC